MFAHVMHFLSILGIALLVIIGICTIIYLIEKREWNKGFCRECKKRWKSFDMASDSSVGYRCGPHGNFPNHDHVIWLNFQFKTPCHIDDPAEVFKEIIK